MNKNLSLRIIDYLNQKTNYAIIISGRYGIGKTFYLENTLFPEIKTIKMVDGEEEQKYKTLRISLFGISSIEELEKLIFFEAYPILKNKGIQIFGGILKGVAKYASIDLDSIAKDTGLTPNEINNYENFVICFDDIDRKSSSLELSEVYGFINNLVENKGAKIILIANEDILRKEVNNDQTDNYSILREKVIGITFPFKPNIESIISNLIEKYQAETDYYEFLKHHSTYIVNSVKIKDDNLRNLIFFLEHFNNVYKQTSIAISKDQNLNKIKDEVLVDILKFTLPIAFEYKLGKLNDENLNLIIDYFTNKLYGLSLFRSKQENNKKNYIDEFTEQYNVTDLQLLYFQNILNYIIGYNILEADNLLLELKELYKTESLNFSEKELIFNKLKYWNCVNLSSKEYKSETRNLLKLIDNNKATLDEFPIIFHYVTRFDNLLNLKIDNLKNKFINKIKKGKYEYIKNIRSRFYINSSEKYIAEIQEIMQICIQKNIEILDLQKQKNLEEIFKSFQENFDNFIEDFQNINNEFIAQPFFASFSFNKFWQVINKLSNSQLVELGFMIESRYRQSIYSEILVEKDFLVSLRRKFEGKINSSKSTKLNIASLKNVIEKIDKVMPNF